MSKVKVPRVRLKAKILTVALLDHDIFCVGTGKCRCIEHTFQEIHRNKRGEIGRRYSTKKYPHSETFLVSKVTEIEETALKCPAIAKAIARGDLRRVP